MERFINVNIFYKNPMGNLNDIIQIQVNWNFDRYPIEVELKLGEEHFPELSHDMQIAYAQAFGQLYGEVIDTRHRPSKVRISSKLEQDVQILIIEHNGGQISERVLEKLNSELESCARGQANYEGRAHGNHIAANILYKYGGRLKILTINDGVYSVQTKVELPVPNIPPIP